MKKRINKIIYLVLIIAFSIIFIYSGYKIISYLIDNRDNRELKTKTKKYTKVNDDTQTIERKYNIDFQKLKEQNPDTVAYLKVEGTNIDYVVVRGNNNSYYLSRNFDKNYNVAGWVFADYRNKLDTTDKNIIIYGHAIRDGSMFGTLKNVLTEEWQKNEKNKKIELVTENGEYIYEVFSTYIVNEEDYYITTDFINDEFESFIKKIKDRSNNDYKVDLSDVTSILTLSACSDDDKGRVVLHAKLIKEINY